MYDLPESIIRSFNFGNTKIQRFHSIDDLWKSRNDGICQIEKPEEMTEEKRKSITVPSEDRNYYYMYKLSKVVDDIERHKKEFPGIPYGYTDFIMGDLKYTMLVIGMDINHVKTNHPIYEAYDVVNNETVLVDGYNLFVVASKRRKSLTKYKDDIETTEDGFYYLKVPAKEFYACRSFLSRFKQMELRTETVTTIVSM